MEDAEPVRGGDTRSNPLPESLRGCLDVEQLKLLGMHRGRLVDEEGLPDPLFFYQLLKPIQNPDLTGLWNEKKTENHDTRMGYYHLRSRHSNLYAIRDLLMGEGIGHKWVNTEPYEQVRFDGALFQDGVLGGSDGAILRRFDDTTPYNSGFNKLISDSITKT